MAFILSVVAVDFLLDFLRVPWWVKYPGLAVLVFCTLVVSNAVQNVTGERLTRHVSVMVARLWRNRTRFGVETRLTVKPDALSFVECKIALERAFGVVFRRNGIILTGQEAVTVGNLRCMVTALADSSEGAEDGIDRVRDMFVTLRVENVFGKDLVRHLDELHKATTQHALALANRKLNIGTISAAITTPGWKPDVLRILPDFEPAAAEGGYVLQIEGDCISVRGTGVGTAAFKRMRDIAVLEVQSPRRDATA